VTVVEALLGRGGDASGDQPHDAFIAFCPDHEHQADVNRADRDETLLEVRVLLVEELENFVVVIEDVHGILEAQTVLQLVGSILLFVPLELHVFSVLDLD
jgi:hypothetical protein